MLFDLILSVQARNCTEQFEIFKVKYNIIYKDSETESASFDVFCINLKRLEEVQESNPNVGMTRTMDRTSQQLSGGIKSKRLSEGLTRKTSTYSCADYICGADDPLTNLSTLLPSIDLREAGLMTPAKDQGQCGCCYAFSAIAVLENSIIRDEAYYKTNNSFWDKTNTTVNLSEQFLISNDFGFESYCDGGDQLMAWNWILKHESTVEIQADFPYSYSAYKSQWTNQQALAPKLASSNFLLPFKTFVFNSSTYYDMSKVPSIELYYNTTTPFNSTAISKVKSYLSRGLAVAISIYVGSDATFEYYSGGGQVLYSKCTYDSSGDCNVDHAVTIVGYGKKGGKDVWIVKNSWSDTWGDNGFFFLEIGKDSYCSEHTAYSLIPKNLSLTGGSVSQGVLNRNQTYSLDYDNCSSGLLMDYSSGVQKCVSACPTAAAYIQIGGLSCGSTCASGYFQMNSTFQSPQCISSCAFPLTRIQSSSHNNYYQCESTCQAVTGIASQFLYLNQTCSSACLYQNKSNLSQFICEMNGTGRSSRCPFFSPISSTSNFLCLNACTAGSVQYQGECLSACPQEAPILQDNGVNCSSTCPSNESYYQSKCVSQCPTGFFIYGVSRYCVEQCPEEAIFADINGICVQHCSQKFYSYHAQTVQKYSCMQSCASFYVQTTLFDNQCVSQCPQSYIYTQDTECLTTCPLNTTANSNNECVQNAETGMNEASLAAAIAVPICVVVAVVVVVVVVSVVVVRKKRNEKKKVDAKVLAIANGQYTQQ